MMNSADLHDELHEVEEMASDLKIAALGRPFTLGMLYDARKDKLITGRTLWNNETLRGKITENVQRKSQFEITTSDSIESKSTLLEVDASLKASFLCGLIQVGGSAKYLNDQKKFKNQSRVTCEFKSTTNFKQLSGIDHATKDLNKMYTIHKSSATHVVTGILYGANAFFVFDSEKIENSSVQDIQVNMKAVIKKIPKLSVEASAGIKLTNEEKTLTDKCSCKFIGDFKLTSIPATFEDAVKTYVQLPDLLGEKGENSVPVTVWLMPLKILHSKAKELKSEISVGLVRKMQDALEGLSEIRMRCNESLEDGVVKDFLILQEELETFQKLCQYYADNLQQTMKKKLPSIRGGKEDESSAEKVFDDRHNSPFSQDKLSKWLDGKEREINVMRACVDIMKGIKIVRNPNELDKEVLKGENVVCFVFTSAKRWDTFLDKMATYLKIPKLGSTNEDQWFYSDEVFTRMRSLAKDFYGYTSSYGYSHYRYLITAIPNEKYKGATVYHYWKGVLYNDAWIPS